MIKTFRAAAIAAAVALSCTGQAAAAETQIAPGAHAAGTQISPAAHAAAATPVTTLDTNAPAVAAAPAVLITLPAAISDRSSADTALTPGRVRPDRAEPVGAAPLGAAPSAAPAAVRSLSDLVAEHARSETSGEQFECLARAVYFESRGELLEGQLAVAEVILNRVRSGRFRGTVCDVVKQPSQFSFVRRGVIPEAPRDSATWHRAVAIAHIAMENLHDVTGEDSLFFHATYVNPGWGRPRIARIGNHIFYR